MLAQILGTFGLALVLRYAAFWAFTANFVSLPDNLVGGTFAIGGLRIEASRLIAGVMALVLTLGMHLVLTRPSSAAACWRWPRTATPLCSWASAPTPCRRWHGVGAASTGVAGALIAYADSLQAVASGPDLVWARSHKTDSRSRVSLLRVVHLGQRNDSLAGCRRWQYAFRRINVRTR